MSMNTSVISSEVIKNTDRYNKKINKASSASFDDSQQSIIATPVIANPDIKITKVSPEKLIAASTEEVLKDNKEVEPFKAGNSDKTYGIIGGAFYGAGKGAKLFYKLTGKIIGLARTVSSFLPLIGWAPALALLLLTPLLLLTGIVFGVPVGFVVGAIMGPSLKKDK